jgi:hypothetical protein
MSDYDLIDTDGVGGVVTAKGMILLRAWMIEHQDNIQEISCT